MEKKLVLVSIFLLSIIMLGCASITPDSNKQAMTDELNAFCQNKMGTNWSGIVRGGIATENQLWDYQHASNVPAGVPFVTIGCNLIGCKDNTCGSHNYFFVYSDK